MKNLRQKIVAMAAVVAVSGLMMASVAGAADKLIVNNAAGAPVFKVSDIGALTTAGTGTVSFGPSGSTNPDLVVVRNIVNGGTVMFLDGVGEVGSGPNIAIRAGRGVVGAMNPTLVGDIVGQANFRGAAGPNGSAAFAGIRRSGFVAYATENYTTTGQGTNVSFVTTQNGTTTPTEKLIVDGSGLVYIGQAMKDGSGNMLAAPTVSSNTKLAIVGDGIRITATRSPAQGSTCSAGEISWDAGFVYVCTAPNTWKRAALTGY